MTYWFTECCVVSATVVRLVTRSVDMLCSASLARLMTTNRYRSDDDFVVFLLHFWFVTVGGWNNNWALSIWNFVTLFWSVPSESYFRWTTETTILLKNVTILRKTKWNKGERFLRYDFGLKGNMERYGKPVPDHYNLSLVTAPVYILWANNDIVSPPQVTKFIDLGLKWFIFHGSVSEGCGMDNG